MEWDSCSASDGCQLAFQTSRPLANVGSDGPRHCVLLMHGFSGSSDYFVRNFGPLSEHSWVVAPDMRGHGKSGRPRGGYHVARLAADLQSIVQRLRSASPNVRIVPVGCSIGAAVIWTYIELFGCDPFAAFCFVDQAPLQDRSPRFDAWDASKAHTGCYDEATMLAAQDAWITTPAAAHVDLVASCLGYRHAPEATDSVSPAQQAEDETFFTEISALCDQSWLARLLADHTRYDHREAAELITRPTIVMAGRRSGCFPLEGMLETTRRVNVAQPGLARSSVYDAGHWLFFEEPARFNKEIVQLLALADAAE
ncbi:Alpha/Beta hydrolase protein [Plectosphaerella plurivora]|uniref:Alpha/Beta hydrolase protein n=1 Tax=Plectosphaerella plurivora TaxID=936078 RepID=A0A9P9AD29_9PEZI|nr:Alpha/Beta hydrolase protein [Plectosphaerella plurivora]